ncbi:hypothetical protein MVEN_00965400 [Mycena venus]|uniref:Uncharacterized protein n=1 Tax=Mycena venus TaxID=2733690 RepID=A0A8H6YDH1_9AGAR|nr:hypothetical protein MVEN_00965400 [Mycena venus]
MPKSPSQVYQGLACQKYGIPQFTPEPNENLPTEYQRAGVCIGDVGIWHDGSFDFLFNACCPATHSINSAYGVPEDFAAFPLHPRDISRRPYYSPGSVIASAQVSETSLNIGGSSVIPGFPMTVGSSVTFNFHSREGAMLVLPQGASRQNLMPVETFRAHVKKYSAQWYRFARGFLPSTDSLFVVTGCDKTASWGIATASTTSGTVEISLKLTVVGIAEGSLAPRYQWKDFGSATVRMSGNDGSPGTENQCIFIRGFFVPRPIPVLTSVANKVLSRGLSRALARRSSDGVQQYGIRADGSSVLAGAISISETEATVREENAGDKFGLEIQILPCD